MAGLNRSQPAELDALRCIHDLLLQAFQDTGAQLPADPRMLHAVHAAWCCSA